MPKGVEKRMIRLIYRQVPGWVFSQRDFASMASREAINLALHRLWKRGEIRRVIRGLYDRPEFSELLGQELGPDLSQVAEALARKFGWRIQPSGAAACNLLGLSSQLPAQLVYRSDGPDRSYRVGNSILRFQKTALKEAGFRHRESSLIVQALKSLGEERMTPELLDKVRAWLPEELRRKVLLDTRTATGWAYAAIQEICREGE